jgi:hypothetical protein
MLPESLHGKVRDEQDEDARRRDEHRDVLTLPSFRSFQDDVDDEPPARTI